MCPVRRHQQRLGDGGDLLPSAVRPAGGSPAQRGAAGLPCVHHRHPPGLECLDQQRGLRGLAAAVDPLERDQARPSHQLLPARRVAGSPPVAARGFLLELLREIVDEHLESGGPCSTGQRGWEAPFAPPLSSRFGILRYCPFKREDHVGVVQRPVTSMPEGISRMARSSRFRLTAYGKMRRAVARAGTSRRARWSPPSPRPAQFPAARSAARSSRRPHHFDAAVRAAHLAPPSCGSAPEQRVDRLWPRRGRSRAGPSPGSRSARRRWAALSVRARSFACRAFALLRRPSVTA